ncbi:hypothetical protein RRG08_004250 [Elysia crispata]|uniref:Uncharacterized protein n=1 Tax=Elysia crispata TaxID=231223 RepID=A0AAE1DWU6_9GAST|nr:hypothetical protein RRG08_004250 [Elysia crispata]
MELFVTERGNKALRFNNYTYRLIEVNKKSKRFRSAFQERRVQARRHREREATRQAIISAYRKGEINQEEFLRRISFKSLPPKM